MTLGCLSASTALAQTDDGGQAAADSLTKEFNEKVAAAKKDYDQANYRSAIENLRAAFRIKENARLLLNIARSYEKMGDCARALVYYRSYLRHPDAEDPFSGVAERRMDERQSCENFSDELAGRLTILSLPKDAIVEFNGREVGKTPIELVGAMTGDHQLTLKKEGYETIEQLVRLDPAEDELLRFELKEAKPAPTATPQVPKVEPEPKSFQLNPIAAGIGGAGVGLLVMGMVYDLAVIPATDDERAPFPRGTPEFDRLTEERSRESTMAVVGYAAGGVLIAGGAGWIMYEYSQHQADRKAEDPVVTIGSGPGDVGASIELRF